MYCEKCGGQNNDSATYCVTCGATLDHATAQHGDHNFGTHEPTIKQRHGCLTAYLIVMIVIASIGILFTPMSLVMRDSFQQAYPDYDINATWATWVGLVLSIVLIAFAIAVFKWKKWAVWGFITVTIIQLSISNANGIANLPGMTDDIAADIVRAITIVFSIVIYALIIGLFVVSLRMGRPNGWNQMD